MQIEAIIFYILLIDSIGAVLTMLFGGKYYTEHSRLFSRLFPITTGWPLVYLATVLWAGSALYRLGIIF